jgi:hypothetical protein
MLFGEQQVCVRKFACTTVRVPRIGHLTIAYIRDLCANHGAYLEVAQINNQRIGEETIQLRMFFVKEQMSASVISRNSDAEQNLVSRAAMGHVMPLMWMMFGSPPPQYIAEACMLDSVSDVLPKFDGRYTTFSADVYMGSRDLVDSESESLIVLDTFDGLTLTLRNFTAREFMSRFSDLVDHRKHNDDVMLGQAALVYATHARHLTSLLQCAASNQDRFKREPIPNTDELSGSEKMVFASIAKVIDKMEKLRGQYGDRITFSTLHQ